VEKKVSVKLDEASPDRVARDGGRAESDGTDDKASLGVSVAPLTPELAERFDVPKDAHGLLVQDVNPDGRAASAGIRQGDIIQSVNRQPVKSVADLRSALKSSSDKPVLLLINRQGNNVFVTVRPSNG
jgi:serine protease Do